MPKVKASYKGKCRCAEFLAPVTTWKEIAQRHDQTETLTSTLRIVSDPSEDWVIAIFRCNDCGRCWALEDVGLPWVTRSYAFFYYFGCGNIGSRLRAAIRSGGILGQLSRDDPDFKELIEPHLPFSSLKLPWWPDFEWPYSY